jgi:hypothetical protein
MRQYGKRLFGAFHQARRSNAAITKMSLDTKAPLALSLV